MPTSVVEYTDADDAVRKFMEELRKLGLLERFISNAVGFMDAEPLRRLDREISERMEYLENIRLRDWDEADLKKYLAMLTPDAIEFLSLLMAQYGKASKKTVMEEFKWGKMKVAGVVAGITRIAKSMDRKPLVERTWIRAGVEWDILYKISNDKYLEILERELKK